MNNPSMLIVIIAVLTSAAVSIILVVQNNRRKSAIRELNNAARKLVKEQNLSTSLRNEDAPGSENKIPPRGRVRMVVGLEWKDREKESYVFDPMEGIRIGRGPQNNNVIIPDDEVSLHHCVLYQASSDLILEDLHSTNGTVLMHGLNKRRIRGRVRIFDGDRICVGSTEMTVHVFWIDSAYI